MFKNTLLAKALGLAQFVYFLLLFFLSQFLNGLVAAFYDQVNLASAISSYCILFTPKPQS